MNDSNPRFAGQYFDAETGLHYNYHRYYDPKTGRYLTPDPISLAGGINLYAYAYANPINLIDSFGLSANLICYRCKDDSRGALSCIAKEDNESVFSFNANTGGPEKNYPGFKPSIGGDPYGVLGPLPPNITYEVIPRRTQDGKYPPGTPSITEPGKEPGSLRTPKRTDRTHIYVHKMGRTDGCLACEGGAENLVKDLMNRNMKRGGTTFTILEVDCNECKD